RHVDVRREVRHHVLFVEWNDLRLAVCVVLGEESTPWTKAVVRVRNGQIDRLDPHLEDISRIRSLDEDWTGENVPARATVLHRVINGPQRWLYVAGLDASLLETRWAGRDQRADDHFVAGLHAQHRHGRGVVIPESN